MKRIIEYFQVQQLYEKISSDNQVQRLYRSDAVPRVRQKGRQALDSAHTKGKAR